MNNKPWSMHEDIWLLTHRHLYGTYDALTSAFNEACETGRTREAIKTRLTHKHRCGIGRDKGAPYTDAERRYVLNNYKTMTLRELAEGINRLSGRRATAGAISHYMTDILGISRYGRNSPIRPGEQIGYTAPIGTERKNADGYMLVKVSDTGIKNADWKTKQAVMWEKYHNKPPDGVVVFLNGDRTDFRENNLYCVSRKAHGIMCLNKWYTEDSERTLAAIKLCELLVAIKATNKNEEMEDEEC